MILDPQILTYELCASPAPSDCAEDISYFWPLFAGQLWPYLLDSSILCTKFCPAQRQPSNSQLSNSRTLGISCEECELVMNQLGDFITSENTILASGMLLEVHDLWKWIFMIITRNTASMRTQMTDAFLGWIGIWKEPLGMKCFFNYTTDKSFHFRVLIQSGRDQYYHSECLELFSCAKKV